MQEYKEKCPTLRSEAFLASATERFDVSVEIFLPVIIGQFFSRLDISLGDDENPTRSFKRLTVRPARVIDIPSLVPTRTPIYVEILVHIEHVFVIQRIADAFGDTMPDILDYRLTLPDNGKRNQAEAGFRSLDTHIELIRCLLH